MYNKNTGELTVPDITMYEMIKRLAQNHPFSAAYEYLGATGTYSELLDGIDRFAKSFAACGVRAGDIVTICMPNTPEAVFAIYALNKIGAAANVIHPLSAQTEIRNCVNSADSRVLAVVDMCVEKIRGIIDETKLEKVVVISPADSMPALLKAAYRLKTKKVRLPEDARFINLKEFVSAGEKADLPVTQASPDLPAVILHSGGTTGTPKEIVLTNRGFNSLGTQALIVLKDVGVNDRVLAILPVFHAFGLGVPTGIELVETVGNMSSEATHRNYVDDEWHIGDTMQAAIGQSDSIFSPLQLAEYCATVANSGTRHSASILKEIRSYDYSEKLYERETEVLSTVDSPEYNWAAVHQGMYLVLNDWSVNGKNAEHWVDCAWTVAGKTGTAQKGEKITNDGIFMCYAPYDNPEVAVAIVVERGGAGANVQFMARQIIDAYINIRSYHDTSVEEMTLLR